MLTYFFTDTLSLGIAQALVAALLALGMVWIARGQSIHIERETIVALVRAMVQIVLVGSILIVLLRGPQWTSIIALLAMMIAAAATAARRAGEIPHAFRVSLIGILVGSGAVIALMTWLGVIDSAITSVIPVGSMLIFNAMTTTGLALNRFESEVKAHVGQIEAGLALGASSQKVVAPYVQAAVHAGLIPRIDSLRSLGIVWIPGLMAGMVLTGEDPIYAAVYQFVVMALVFVVAGLTSVVTTMLIRNHAFSTAEQLVIRPGKGNTGKPLGKKRGG
jgi:putative ABC transport system permease protein